MPVLVGQIIGYVTAFLVENAIVLLVFAASSILGMITSGVRKLAKGGR